jgi:hypothetical protein
MPANCGPQKFDVEIATHWPDSEAAFTPTWVVVGRRRRRRSGVVARLASAGGNEQLEPNAPSLAFS